MADRRSMAGAKPMVMHLLHEFASQGIAGIEADDGVDSTPRAKGGLPNAFPLVRPLADLGRRKCFAAIETPAHLAREYFIAISDRMAMCSDDIGSHCCPFCATERRVASFRGTPKPR